MQGFDGKIYSGNKEITVKVKFKYYPYFKNKK